MGGLSEDMEVKVSVEAAETFANTYYANLNKPHGAKELQTFYVQSNPASPLKPDITLNGNLVKDPTELEAIFEKQPAKTHYEVQSFDCHVLNPNYNVGAHDDSLEPNKAGKKMSILVLISGSVRYGEEETQGFTDNIVLVPNWEILGKPPKGKRKWLIQSQTFRVIL
ncbi:NTF2-like protein [Venustampulla echinocandica]|uniref:NTF2-like protein n=1 Tax=Venustampulla echinocandica TaxID=2656787 RepID=A0A370U082_9HELO|nr:NTF2-like protein [Venustampulla echinocandica]RDL41192.1 NTF2-like protein [Venustampulla echinocandica]